MADRVGEPGGRSRRIAERPNEEGGHLGAGHRIVGAEVGRIAALGDAGCEEAVDVVLEGVADGVDEPGRSSRRKAERPVQEGGHLATGHDVAGTEAPVLAALCDTRGRQRLDVVPVGAVEGVGEGERTRDRVAELDHRHGIALREGGEPVLSEVVRLGGSDADLVTGVPRGVPAGAVPGDLLGADHVELAGFHDPQADVGVERHGAAAHVRQLVHVGEDQLVNDVLVGRTHLEGAVHDNVGADGHGGRNVRVERQCGSGRDLEPVRIAVAGSGQGSGDRGRRGVTTEQRDAAHIRCGGSSGEGAGRSNDHERASSFG